MSDISITINQFAIQVIRDRASGRPIGTSFSFLRPEWVATAKHVVIADALPRKGLEVQFVNGQIVAAEVYACHPEIDVAVLRLNERGPCEISLFPACVRFTGQRGLFSAGYRPSLSDPNRRHYKIEVNLVDQWELESRSRAQSEEEVIHFHSPFVEPGHSGGPLFGEGGGVIGVVTQVFQRDNVRFGRATSILSLMNGLEMRAAWQL